MWRDLDFRWPVENAPLMDDRSDAPPSYLARIHCDGGFVGTAFSISPRVLVTCRHVWLSAKTSAPTARFGLANRPIEFSIKEGIAYDEGRDIALLMTAEDVPGPYLSLADELTEPEIKQILQSGAESVGFQDRDQGRKDCRSPIHLLSPLYVAGKSSTSVLADAQIDGGLPEGMSGSPCIIPSQEPGVCIGMAYLGGVAATTSRIIPSSVILDFIDASEVTKRITSSHERISRLPFSELDLRMDSHMETNAVGARTINIVNNVGYHQGAPENQSVRTARRSSCSEKYSAIYSAIDKNGLRFLQKNPSLDVSQFESTLRNTPIASTAEGRTAGIQSSQMDANVVERTLRCVGTLVVGASPDRLIPCGQVSSIGENLLATNAHVGIDAAAALWSGQPAWAVFGDARSPCVSVRIHLVSIHPQFPQCRDAYLRDSSAICGCDIALLHTDTALSDQLRIATRHDLTQLAAGRAIDCVTPEANAFHGGQLELPETVVKQGVIFSATDWNLSEVPPIGDCQLYGHSLKIQACASGSPVLNDLGAIIGVVSAGTLEPVRLSCLLGNTKPDHKMPQVRLSFFQRADLLLDMEDLK